MRLLLAIALLPLATACHASWQEKGTKIEARGEGDRRSFAADGFTGVALKGPDDVDVRIGSKFVVTAQGDPKVLEQLDIRLDGKTLKVGRKNRSGWGGDDGAHAKILVILPRLAEATVAGSGAMRVDTTKGPFDAAVAGSGSLDVAAIVGGEVSVSIAGSGDLHLAGRADSLDVSIAGSGDLKAQDLKAAKADISVAGSGGVRAQVSGPAEISVLGSGDVQLTGGARCKISKIGSGDVTCS